MSQLGQSLPKRDVHVTSVCPSISDIITRRGERRLAGNVRARRACLPKGRWAEFEEFLLIAEAAQS